MKIFGYLLVVIASFLIIVMDIFKLFLGLIRVLGYLFIFAIIFIYFTGKLDHVFLISLGGGAVVCFSIFYGYFFIMNFLVGFKNGLLESLEGKN